MFIFMVDTILMRWMQNSDGLVTLGKEMLKEGVTTYFPTTMTQAPEAIEANKLTAQKKQKKKERISNIFT